MIRFNIYRFALKCSNHLIFNEQELDKNLDIKNLRRLNHENIIKYIEDFIFQKHICIITKYYEVTLKGWFKNILKLKKKLKIRMGI